MTTRLGIALLLTTGFAQLCHAAQPEALGPHFAASGELQRPADYRSWVFVTSGLGMTYGPNAPGPDRPAPFSNVFVNPASYRAFLATGHWPDGTMFVLEIRRAEENVSINAGGRTQGEVVAIEASVKDAKRYPEGGWSYFSFDSPQGSKATAAPFARTADCYSCHRTHGAVDWTFTQFYPELFAVARRLGTVRPDYDPARKAQ
jgi:hypothetical protein